MGLLGDVFSIGSAIAGNKAAKKANKRAKEQLELQKQLMELQKSQVNKGNAQGDYLQLIAKLLQAQDSGYTDPFGGGVEYDPETGQFNYNLNPYEKDIQERSYREEALRNGRDQDRRRTGFEDVERMRQQASGEQDQALRDLDQFRSGVGQVDEAKLASQIALNRKAAVNAGYDDAARAASTIGVRTGASAGDALSEIARNRARDIAKTIGDPELEALQTAEGINSNRLNNKMGSYNLFKTNADKVYDAEFAPSGYKAQGTADKFATQTQDLNRFDTVGSFASNAGSTYIGGAQALAGAANGMNNATQTFNKQYNPYRTAQMLQGFGKSADGILSSIAGAFGGGAGAAGGGGGYDWQTMGS